jgi:recombinational DNA repair protein RecR
MTDLEQLRHLRLRCEKAREIIQNAGAYKVCDQFRSISTKGASTCAICHCYRRDDNPAVVVEMANSMGRNPFPLTIATVPRI